MNYNLVIFFSLYISLLYPPLGSLVAKVSSAQPIVVHNYTSTVSHVFVSSSFGDRFLRYLFGGKRVKLELCRRF